MRGGPTATRLELLRHDPEGGMQAALAVAPASFRPLGAVPLQLRERPRIFEFVFVSIAPAVPEASAGPECNGNPCAARSSWTHRHSARRRGAAGLEQVLHRRAEAAAAQGKLLDSREILKDAKKETPKAIELWTALAALDFPKRIAAKLEVVALLINRIATAAIDQHAVVNLGNHAFKRCVR